MPPSPDRASAADLMQAATGDGRAAGHIGAVLVLDATPGFNVTEARRVLGERIRAVPRLRQRLYRAPPGCGRPYWADDPAFDITEHVRGCATRRRGTSGRCSISPLLVIMDHVLADGVAGLAVLGTLVDQLAETAQARAARFPAPAPPSASPVTNVADQSGRDLGRGSPS